MVRKPRCGDTGGEKGQVSSAESIKCSQQRDELTCCVLDADKDHNEWQYRHNSEFPHEQK
jgi:hypothetical protein